VARADACLLLADLALPDSLHARPVRPVARAHPPGPLPPSALHPPTRPTAAVTH